MKIELYDTIAGEKLRADVWIFGSLDEMYKACEEYEKYFKIDKHGSNYLGVTYSSFNQKPDCSIVYLCMEELKLSVVMHELLHVSMNMHKTAYMTEELTLHKDLDIEESIATTQTNLFYQLYDDLMRRDALPLPI